jgi:hypothetical protein
LDFLSIPSGSGDKKVKREEDISGAAGRCSPVILLRGRSLLIDGGIDPLVDLATNVEGGVEGFLDFLGADEE